ncbi:MAG: lamin tail domain-containing protein [Crocinitomicaceae bacterium]
MRYILTSLLLSVTLLNYAQILDNFSDGDFTSNPIWVGETTNFEIDANNQLHLNAPAVTDTAYLVTSNSFVDNTEWTFSVDLDFNPSSANLVRVYLMSSQSDLKNNLNGYFVQIGGSEDEVSLYKQAGTTITEIIDGTDDVVNSNPVSVRVKVTRTSVGEWTLEADNTGNLNYVNQGTTNDNSFTTSSFFGVFCKYTSTRSDKFYFDEFSVQPMIIIDTIAPQITSVDVVSNQVLMLWFTESVDALTAENVANYSVNYGLGSPSQAELIASNNQIVELTFPPSFQDGIDYTLSVQNVQDDSGNVMPNSTIHFMYNKPYFGMYKDIVITEIMADPNPSVGLPDAEYIELYNNTDQTISLENWSLSDGSTTVILSNYSISPQSYMLWYDPAGGASFGLFNVIENTLPSLNNAADVITLMDSTGLVIDSVAYTIGWYNNIQKALGGWSLELKNINSPCHDRSNWSASENIAGGTPGDENSIYTNIPVTTLPKIMEVYIENDSNIHFVFDKIISEGTVNILPTVSHNLLLNNTELIISLNNFKHSETYSIVVSSYKDCWGNITEDFTYLFGLPQNALSKDVLINEVLFNPSAKGADYIELVNVSDKVLSLNEFQIANIDEGIIDNLSHFTSQQILWFPGDYLVLTKDSSAVIETFSMYEGGHFLEMDLPSYNNDSGTVIILNLNTEIIDKFSYSENMHFQLIDDLNGKALERLSFTHQSQSDDNWHTASEVVGWGTPGYLNSQTSSPSFEKNIQLSQAIFSPDNDGYQDLLEITYQFDNPDNVLDVVVYNSSGQPIKELKDNFYPGKKGSIVWDGLTDEGTKASVGTYVIGVTVFDLDGNLKRYKLVGVLATRL